MNREKIQKIIEETRNTAEQQYRENKNNQELQKIIIKQAEINLEQLEKEYETINYYRNKLEVIFNSLDEEKNNAK